MVQIQKAEKKAVYRHLLLEGVMVIHKNFTSAPHKGTNIANIKVWMLLKSLKDRGYVELVFNWQYYYYFLNQEGKKYIAEFLGLTEDVVPLSWKYFIFLLIEKTKKGNMSILKIKERRKRFEETEIMLQVLNEQEVGVPDVHLKSKKKQPKRKKKFPPVNDRSCYSLSLS
jgi:small subunit ribosomal protein S10e